MTTRKTSRIVRSTSLVAGAGCLVAAPLHAQGVTLDTTPSKDATLPGMEMLVDGSILQKILIPEYDEHRRLSSVLRADKLVLINDRTIDATAVRIEFYHPDRSLKAGINLATALLYDQRLLRSSDPVTLESNDLTASGSGLVYELDRSRGFLHGPATARTLIDTRTSMNPRPTRRFAATGVALMAASALSAQEDAILTEQELQGLDRLAVSQASIAEEAEARADGQIEQAEALGKGADESLRDFLKVAAVEMEDGKKPDLTKKVPDPEIEKQIKLPASIEARKGIFFDSETGILIFLEDVDIEHPDFTLTGADEVKVFMEKEQTPAPDPKPDGAGPTPPKPQNEKGDLLGEAEFGDPTRIVATGAVVVEQKGEKKAKASGRQMVMDLRTNELIIRGGEPWIISDTANGRVVDPNGYIMINLKSGDASFVGDSRGFIELDKDR
ncbi:hypothetical protein [Haloferula sp. A504]|uniref:hypothetical protein n=1 Tax=Haloferula sp. A504 TaxID=3373601 RepID=UPI0031CA8CB2|nr:hypothetical protein [Verrucomicrobiaceae bacterium E54]